MTKITFDLKAADEDPLNSAANTRESLNISEILMQSVSYIGGIERHCLTCGSLVLLAGDQNSKSVEAVGQSPEDRGAHNAPNLCQEGLNRAAMHLFVEIGIEKAKTIARASGCVKKCVI